MYEIKINPERLKHFPKTVPMNIREAVIVVIDALTVFEQSKPPKKQRPRMKRC